MSFLQPQIWLGLFGSLVLAAAAQAGDVDRALHLWHRAEQAQQDQASRAAAQAAEIATETGTEPNIDQLTHQDQVLAIPAQNAQQLTIALFLAINQRRWPELRHLASIYRQQPEADTELLLLAQAALDAADGQLDLAEQGLQSALAAQPNFVRARLDLARLQFERRHDREAQQNFQQILTSPGLPEQVQRNLEQGFLRAIQRRNGWSGSAALGWKHSSNLNQSQASSTCLMPTPQGCAYLRTTPAPLSGQGSSYELTASRRQALRGPHGVQLRGLVYGDQYAEQRRYSETSASLYAGYSHHQGGRQWLLAPLLEAQRSGGRRLYTATGLRLEAIQELGPRLAWQLLAEQKRLRYRRDYAAALDASQQMAVLSAFYGLGPGSTGFAGLDWTRRSSRAPTESYQQRGLRLGLQQSLGEVQITAMAIWRRRLHAAYSPLLGGQREEHQRMLLLSAKAPTWRLGGLSPVLSLRRTLNQSSIGWLYRYRQTQISLQLEGRF